MSPSLRKEKIEKEELFDLIVENFPVGLIIVNHNEEILEFNPAAEKITGFKKEEVLGKNCHQMLPGIPCHLKDVGKRALANNEDKIFVHLEGTITHKNGHEIPVCYTAAPLVKDSQLKGAIAIFREITNEKKLEQHRRVLISMFAHDLKGPLAIAGGLLLRLREGKAGKLNDKQIQYLDTIIKEIKKVDKYIKSFLDIVRMETGQISLSKELCDIHSLISEVLGDIKIRAREKGMTIRMDIPEDLPLVYVDKYQLQRVMFNLLDNAIKYSPPGSEIDISCRDMDDSILCVVEDSGPGIKEEDLPYIFDPFYRANYSEDVEGTGIGLAIVKTIIEAHGGKVWVKNKRPPRHGAVFSFIIPKANKSDRQDWNITESRV